MILGVVDFALIVVRVLARVKTGSGRAAYRSRDVEVRKPSPLLSEHLEVFELDGG